MLLFITTLSVLLFAKSAPTTACPSYFDANQCQIFKDTNSARKDYDLPPLKPSPACTKLAKAHAVDMYNVGKLFHTSPKFGNFSARVEAFSVPGNWHGENVFWSSQGSKHAPKVVDGWMKSPGHKKNILHKKAKTIGIGVRNGYFAQCFSDS